MQKNNHFFIARLEERMTDVAKGNIQFLLLSGQESESIHMSLKIPLGFLSTQIRSCLQILEYWAFPYERESCFDNLFRIVRIPLTSTRSSCSFKSSLTRSSSFCLTFFCRSLIFFWISAKFFMLVLRKVSSLI